MSYHRGEPQFKTVAIPDTKRDDIVERVKNACLNEGKQAYWVCTLIDESEVLEAQAAADTAEELQRKLPDVKIGLVHGRMKPAEKQAVMQEFKENKLHLLVATTVIEVGVDVPNSSLMIIEKPRASWSSTTAPTAWPCWPWFGRKPLCTAVSLSAV